MGATPVFAYLLLKEHPYGREMLRQMLSEGFVPTIIIEEDSAIGDEEREKFLKRIEVATAVLARRQRCGTRRRGGPPLPLTQGSIRLVVRNLSHAVAQPHATPLVCVEDEQYLGHDVRFTHCDLSKLRYK